VDNPILIASVVHKSLAWFSESSITFGNMLFEVQQQCLQYEVWNNTKGAWTWWHRRSFLQYV